MLVARGQRCQLEARQQGGRRPPRQTAAMQEVCHIRMPALMCNIKRVQKDASQEALFVTQRN